MAERILLIDATGLIFRAYYSITPLTTPEGAPVNAVFGLLRILLKVFRDTPADASAFIFDAGKRTFRNEIFPDYKTQRPEPPEDLRPQFSMSIDLARATEAPVFVMPGFEADDLIATIAAQATGKGMKVSILTGDKDILQLVSPDINVLLPAKRGELTSYDEAAFDAKYGFAIDRFVDFKALMGDPSDNIPGIPGVGEKTAAKLVSNYGKLEQIYGNLDIIKPQKLAQKLKDARDDVFLYRELVTLKSDVPVTYDFESRTLPNFASKQLADMITAMGFNRLKQDAEEAGDMQSPASLQ